MPSKSIEQLTLKHFLYYPQLTSKYVDGNWIRVFGTCIGLVPISYRAKGWRIAIV